MINLLSPSEKKEILAKRRERMIMIIWALALFFVVSLILVLVSLKIYMQGKIKSQELVVSRAKAEIEKSELKNFQEEIGYINLNLINLNGFYQNQVYFSSIPEKISADLIKGMNLTSVSAVCFEADGKKFFKVNLSGFAPKRDVLFEFKENLERNSSFSEISFPPANWVKSNDINFNVKFIAK